MIHSKKIKLLSLILVVFVIMALFAACKLPGNANNDNNDKKINKSMAKWDGDVFVSEWAGFKIPLPEGWYKATDEEIAAVNQLGAEAVAGINGGDTEDYLNAKAIYPMFILKRPLDQIGADINSNIIIIYEKSAATKLVSADFYLDSIKNQLESAGMGYVVEKLDPMKLGGETYSVMSASIQETNIKQMYFARKLDGYIISFIFTGAIDNAAELNSMIASVEKY